MASALNSVVSCLAGTLTGVPVESELDRRSSALAGGRLIPFSAVPVGCRTWMQRSVQKTQEEA